MNKKIFKCFLLSLILFGCFFFVNSCSALTLEEVYTDLDNCFKNNYYGETFEKEKTVCPDTFNYISKTEIENYLSNLDSTKLETYSNYILNSEYYCLTYDSIGGIKTLCFATGDLSSVSYHFTYGGYYNGGYPITRFKSCEFYKWLACFS